MVDTAFSENSGDTPHVCSSEIDLFEADFDEIGFNLFFASEFDLDLRTGCDGERGEEGSGFDGELG